MLIIRAVTCNKTYRASYQVNNMEEIITCYQGSNMAPIITY